MQHNKRYAAALLAGVLLLTGCGAGNSVPDQDSGGDLHDMIEVQKVRETDISKRYPEYFKYCFGEDATYTYLESDSENHWDYYELTYHDHTGALRKEENRTAVYGEKEAKKFPTAEEYYAREMEKLAKGQLNQIFKFEFGHEILEKYLDGHYNDAGHWESDTEQLLLTPVMPVYICQDYLLTPDDPVGQRLAHAHIQQGTGWQVCKADWKTIAADEQWYVSILIHISKSADAAAYQEKIRKIMEAYRAAASQPKSFTIKLNQYDSEDETDSHLVSGYTEVLGEKIGREGKDETYSALEDHAKRLIEKHKND